MPNIGMEPMRQRVSCPAMGLIGAILFPAMLYRMLADQDEMPAPEGGEA
jgi:hypothetical protein